MMEFFFSFLLFVVATLMVLLSATSVIFRYFEDELGDIFDYVLLLFLFSGSEILMVLMLLGFASQLLFPWVFVLVLVLFLFSQYLLPFWRTLSKLRQLFLWPKENFFTLTAALLFLPLLVYLGIELINSFFQAPWEYDTLAYHLPIAVAWMKSHSLWTIFYAAWGGPLGYYPSSHELLTTWFLLPFGKDFFVSLPNFLIAIMIIVVMSKTLMNLKVPKTLSLLSGALLFSMPLLLRQIGTSQVDLLVALSVGLCWYYLLRSFLRRDGKLLIPFLLSFALLLGSKYLALLYGIPIVMVFLLMASFWKRKTNHAGLFIFFIGGIFGCAWYWRNLILTGNPIFPAELTFGSLQLFSGYENLSARIQELSLWTRFTESQEFFSWVIALLKETGWQIYLLIFAYLLLLLEILLKLIFGKFHKGEGRVFCLMLFFVPVYWYLYVNAPYTASMMEHNIRYAIPWLMLSMMLICLVISKLSVLKRSFTVLLFFFVWLQIGLILPEQRLGQEAFLNLSWISVFWKQTLLFGAALVFLIFSFFQWKRKRLAIPFLILSVAISFLFFVQVVPLRDEFRHFSWQRKYDFPLFKAYEWLDEHAQGGAVANSLNPLYYPLYGNDLGREVSYININACRDCDYAGYHRLKATLRESPEYEAWKENLETFGTDFLVLGYSVSEGLEAVTPHELEWVEEHPEIFEKVFQEGAVKIYKVIRADAGSRSSG